MSTDKVLGLTETEMTDRLMAAFEAGMVERSELAALANRATQEGDRGAATELARREVHDATAVSEFARTFNVLDLQPHDLDGLTDAARIKGAWSGSDTAVDLALGRIEQQLSFHGSSLRPAEDPPPYRLPELEMIHYKAFEYFDDRSPAARAWDENREAVSTFHLHELERISKQPAPPSRADAAAHRARMAADFPAPAQRATSTVQQPAAAVPSAPSPGPPSASVRHL